VPLNFFLAESGVTVALLWFSIGFVAVLPFAAFV